VERRKSCGCEWKLCLVSMAERENLKFQSELENDPIKLKKRREKELVLRISLRNSLLFLRGMKVEFN
jgi:hypothetical protein